MGNRLSLPASQQRSSKLQQHIPGERNQGNIQAHYTSQRYDKGENKQSLPIPGLRSPKFQKPSLSHTRQQNYHKHGYQQTPMAMPQRQASPAGYMYSPCETSRSHGNLNQSQSNVNDIYYKKPVGLSANGMQEVPMCHTPYPIEVRVARTYQAEAGEQHRDPGSGNENRSWMPTTPIHNTEKPSVLLLGNSNVKNLAKSLKERGVDATTVAYSGATAGNIADRVPYLGQRPMRYNRSPDVVYIHAADINARMQVPIQSSIEEVGYLIDSVCHHFPDVKVIMSSVPLTKNRRLNSRIIELNNAVNHMCRENSQVCYQNNDKVDLIDGIHFSVSGREHIARAIAQRIHTTSLFRNTTPQVWGY